MVIKIRSQYSTVKLVKFNIYKKLLNEITQAIVTPRVILSQLIN